MSGSNTYTGVTTVNGGTLALGNVNALATSTLDTGAAGAQQVTFTVAGTNTYNLGGLQGSDDLALGGNTLSVGANNALPPPTPAQSPAPAAASPRSAPAP